MFAAIVSDYWLVLRWYAYVSVCCIVFFKSYQMYDAVTRLIQFGMQLMHYASLEFVVAYPSVCLSVPSEALTNQSTDQQQSAKYRRLDVVISKKHRISQQAIKLYIL